MSRSCPLVGCTGDGSLAECLALGKIPFYEIRQHKTKTFQSFIHLARFLNLKQVQTYFEVLGWQKGPAEELFPILTSESFESEWSRLIAYIHTWGRFEESLTARLRRQLFGTKDFELELAEKIHNGQINFDKAFLSMEAHLRRAASRSGAPVYG